MLWLLDGERKKCHLKICGNVRNAEEVAHFNPDAMGFIFYEKSPRYVLPQQVARIESKGIKRVGVFVNEDPAVVEKTVKVACLDFVQLHGDESPEQVKQLRGIAKVIKVIDGNATYLNEEIKKYEGVADMFLFDHKSESYGGSGEKFRWDNLVAHTISLPFYIAGGIGPGDEKHLKKIFEMNNFFGIDINSKFESEPGVKNIDRIKQFKTAIENETSR